MQKFTLQELSKHVGQRMEGDPRPSSDKMLIAIDGYVYDITKFASLHPGGLAVLRMVAGKYIFNRIFAAAVVVVSDDDAAAHNDG